MHVRLATEADLDAIEAIYNAIHDQEEAGLATIGWDRATYPTRETAQAALVENDLFVMEEEQRIVAAARINQEQVPEYAHAQWAMDAPAQEVMVLHTLDTTANTSAWTPTPATHALAPCMPGWAMLKPILCPAALMASPAFSWSALKRRCSAPVKETGSSKGF